MVGGGGRYVGGGEERSPYGSENLYVLSEVSDAEYWALVIFPVKILKILKSS